MNLSVALAASPADAASSAHVKPCATCGREVRFYDLGMEPKPAPPEPVTCTACDQRAIVKPLGCAPRSA